jgi:hypothetical protein
MTSGTAMYHGIGRMVAIVTRTERCLADIVSAAVIVGKIAPDEVEDTTTEGGKNAAAVALGRMGGKARAEGMSAKRRKEIAKKAAAKRWESWLANASSIGLTLDSVMSQFEIQGLTL